MFKLLGLLVVLGTTFGLGYYAGHHGVTDFKQAAVHLSRDAFDTALGMGLERNLQWQRDLVNAKASVVDAKSELMERNYGSAGRDLTSALDAVRAAQRAESDPEKAREADRLASRIRQIKIGMVAGKPVSRSRLDEVQRDIDRLLAR